MSDTAAALRESAFQARRDNRPADAKRDLVEAVDLCRKADLPFELAETLTGLGQIERDLQRGEAALQHYAEAISIYRAEGNALRLAHSVRHLGDIYREQGRPDLAEPSYREALAIYRSHKQTSPLDLANAIRSLAVLKSDAGEEEQARLLWQEARVLYTGVNVEAGVDEASRRLALPRGSHGPRST